MERIQARVASTVRHEQILSVAAELFAQQGYQGTTTRQIAERAGISEAILFRHFPTKEDLYWAVIESKCKTPQSAACAEEKWSEVGDEQQVFLRIAQEILRGYQQDTTKMRLLLFTALENHRLSHQFFQIYIAGWYELLAAYIRQRIQAGVFRDVDPYLAARSFVGMVIYHILIQELFGGKHYKDFDPQHVSETLTDIWLEGMKVQPKENLTTSEVQQEL
ncbi:MAG: TetR/AcrR family transcriptional regulator [Acidobacteria bacterium]|nr:TetR/AcrR family transcriptional regulator [Acidobacteriota bacterium]